MVLMWILVFALTLIDNVVTSQPCQRLFMQGLDNIKLQPYVTLPGLYHITNITNDGLPACQHETHTDEFFFYNGTQKVPVLGPGLEVAQTNVTIDGYPTYQHETHPNKFFFYNSTRRVLELGQGFVVAQTNGRLPRNNVTYPFSELITGWRIYQPATNRFALTIFFCFRYTSIIIDVVVENVIAIRRIAANRLLVNQLPKVTGNPW